jgi:hypothetical protein
VAVTGVVGGNVGVNGDVLDAVADAVELVGVGVGGGDVLGGCVTDGLGAVSARGALPVKCCTAIRASSAAKPATSAIQRDHRGPRGCWSGGGGGPPESSIHS